MMPLNTSHVTGTRMPTCASLLWTRRLFKLITTYMLWNVNWLVPWLTRCQFWRTRLLVTSYQCLTKQVGWVEGCFARRGRAITPADAGLNHHWTLSSLQNHMTDEMTLTSDIGSHYLWLGRRTSHTSLVTSWFQTGANARCWCHGLWLPQWFVLTPRPIFLVTVASSSLVLSWLRPYKWTWTVHIVWQDNHHCLSLRHGWFKKRWSTMVSQLVLVPILISRKPAEAALVPGIACRFTWSIGRCLDEALRLKDRCWSPSWLLTQLWIDVTIDWIRNLIVEKVSVWAPFAKGGYNGGCFQTQYISSAYGRPFGRYNAWRFTWTRHGNWDVARCWWWRYHRWWQFISWSNGRLIITDMDAMIPFATAL